jgi:methionyl-tRNA formyltransferase
LQNLIKEGHEETQMSAIKVEEELDVGDVYLKQTLSLLGTAEEIFIRADQLIEDMIVEIIEKNPDPQPQKGEVVKFSRRKPEDSTIENINDLRELFDHIRMLDAKGYPKAFLETEHFRFEFSRTSLKTDKIVADVRIFKK